MVVSFDTIGDPPEVRKKTRLSLFPLPLWPHARCYNLLPSKLTENPQ